MSVELKIKKRFDGFLLDAAFQSEGGRWGVLGPSGCGKSLLLRCIAGVETPDEGYIRVNGRVYFDSEKKVNLPPQERNVGLLFQDYALFPHWNVEKNILAGLERVKDPKEKENRMREAIAAFQLQGMEKRLPHQLSGGQKQRVALARMLVGEPEILLFDEPFSALDTRLKERMLLETKKIMDGLDKDILLVTHSRNEAYKLAENLVLMEDGRMGMQMGKKIGCMLLAGGAGTRMGQVNKYGLPYGASTLGVQISEQLEKLPLPLFLSVANYMILPREGWTIVPDMVFDKNGGFIGPLGGIASCLRMAKKAGLDGLFVTSCDLPLFQSEIFEKLFPYIGELPVVHVQTGDGKVHYVCGYYSVSVLPALEETIQAGDYRVRALTARTGAKVVSMRELGLPDAWLHNVNTPEDL